jgi:hypothetical protein
VRDRETNDSELRLVTALRHAARERGGPLPSIDGADALLDERTIDITALMRGPIARVRSVATGHMSPDVSDVLRLAPDRMASPH